jgi:hypothetical protein
MGQLYTFCSQYQVFFCWDCERDMTKEEMVNKEGQAVSLAQVIGKKLPSSPHSPWLPSQGLTDYASPSEARPLLYQGLGPPKPK